MVDGSEAEEHGHEDDRTGCGVNGEEAEEADLGDVDTGHELLDTASVSSTLGVDIVAQDVEGVVADNKVKKGKADTSETKEERRNDGVGERCERLEMSTTNMKRRAIPIIPKFPN